MSARTPPFGSRPGARCLQATCACAHVYCVLCIVYCVLCIVHCCLQAAGAGAPVKVVFDALVACKGVQAPQPRPDSTAVTTAHGQMMPTAHGQMMPKPPSLPPVPLTPQPSFGTLPLVTEPAEGQSGLLANSTAAAPSTGGRIHVAGGVEPTLPQTIERSAHVVVQAAAQAAHPPPGYINPAQSTSQLSLGAQGRSPHIPCVHAVVPAHGSIETWCWWMRLWMWSLVCVGVCVCVRFRSRW